MTSCGLIPRPHRLLRREFERESPALEFPTRGGQFSRVHVQLESYDLELLDWRKKARHD